MIVDPVTGAVRAVIDWELARIGDPIEDLALLEWNMRIWYRSSRERDPTPVRRVWQPAGVGAATRGDDRALSRVLRQLA